MKPWKPAEELKWQLRIRRQNRTSNGPDEDYNWKRFDRNSKVFFCVRPSLPPPHTLVRFSGRLDKSYFYYYIFVPCKTPSKKHRLPQPHTNIAHFRPQDGTLCAYK